jgi:membrane associated rhomboid family serine protease
VFPLKDNIPTERFPVVTVLLIAINCIAYLFLQPKTGIDFTGRSLNQADLVHYGFIPYEITHWGQHCDLVAQGIACGAHGTSPQLPTWVTPFTAMFTHAGLLHLGGNMLFLWIFGNNVEDSMGRIKFLIFYLLGGLAALAGQTLVASGTGEAVPLVGASGAIAAVLGGYLVLYPRARVLTVVFLFLFFTLLEVPAVVMLGIWFVEQVLFGVFGLTDPAGSGGGVAYFAHVGGFVFGLLLIRVFASRRNPAYTLGGPGRLAT